jgi:hypothetical protein
MLQTYKSKEIGKKGKSKDNETNLERMKMHSKRNAGISIGM